MDAGGATVARTPDELRSLNIQISRHVFGHDIKPDRYRVVLWMGERRGEANAETFPLAMCLAALKSLEEVKP